MVGWKGLGASIAVVLETVCTGTGGVAAACRPLEGLCMIEAGWKGSCIGFVATGFPTGEVGLSDSSTGRGGGWFFFTVSKSGAFSGPVTVAEVRLGECFDVSTAVLTFGSRRMDNLCWTGFVTSRLIRGLGCEASSTGAAGG